MQRRNFLQKYIPVVQGPKKKSSLKISQRFCDTRMPPVATKSKSGKISKSHILTPPLPKGHVMSEKCEQPLDEHRVQVWLLYYRPSGTEFVDNWTDWKSPIIRNLLQTFQSRGIKIRLHVYPTQDSQLDRQLSPDWRSKLVCKWIFCWPTYICCPIDRTLQLLRVTKWCFNFHMLLQHNKLNVQQDISSIVGLEHLQL